MRNRLVKHVIIVSVFLFSAVQGTRGDSIFSINGLGQTVYPVSGQARGMGGVSIAALDGRAVSMINPALSGAVDTTTIAGVFIFEQRRIKDDAANATINAWGPKLLRLIIPVGHGLSIGGGLAPYSDVNFHLITDADAAGREYTLAISAEGGTHLGEFSVAANIGDRVYLGAAVNLIFGSISEEWSRTFDDPGFVNSTDRFQSSFYGQEYIGGIVLRPHRAVTVGGLYGLSGHVKATEETGSTLSSLSEVHERNYDFPDSYGLGFTYRVNRKLMIGFDTYAKLWDQFRLDGSPVPRYRNSTRYSFGCELAPSRDKDAPFYSGMPWRFGFYHDSGYYEDSSGARVPETFFTLGTSFFFRENRGAFDLALEVGKRGDRTENGAQEWVIRQSFTIIGWERWFQPREY